jgi:hypothetical protein
LNEETLSAMAAGQSPAEALNALLTAWPQADAGIIALTVDGYHAIGNTGTVLRRGDLGSALRGSREEGALVIVIHNAIAPRHSLAALACEVAWDAMHIASISRWIRLPVGVPIRSATQPAVWIDAAGNVKQVDIEGPRPADRAGIGLGDRVAVLLNDASACGWLGYEPYLMVDAGRIVSVDGLSELRLPVIR